MKAFHCNIIKEGDYFQSVWLRHIHISYDVIHFLLNTLSAHLIRFFDTRHSNLKRGFYSATF